MSKNKEESLHELMAGMKPRGKEPRNAGVLDSWIDHAEADFGIAASGRVRWLIASTVITAMLQQVVDDDNACRFSLKGGTLLQHVFGLASRATKDIDGIVPVSYTHLDVYKRQVRDSKEGFCKEARSSSLIEDIRSCAPTRGRSCVASMPPRW